MLSSLETVVDTEVLLVVLSSLEIVVDTEVILVVLSSLEAVVDSEVLSGVGLDVGAQVTGHSMVISHL